MAKKAWIDTELELLVVEKLFAGIAEKADGRELLLQHDAAPGHFDRKVLSKVKTKVTSFPC